MHRFSEDEAQEILRRATRAPLAGEYTSEELRRSAAELGISDEALARAEAEVREERGLVAFEKALRSQVRGEVLKFVGVVAMLAAINVFTSPHHLWFLYVFFFWGLALAGTVFRSRDRNGAGYRRALDRWQSKEGRVREGELTEVIKG